MNVIPTHLLAAAVTARVRQLLESLLWPFLLLGKLLAGTGRQHDSLYAAEELPARLENRVLRAISSFAMQDWLVALYLMVLLVCVVLGDGPRRTTAIACLVVDSLVFWTCLLIARSNIAKARFAIDLLYRVALIGVVVGSFLQLQYILPTVSDAAYDAEIYGFDVAVFGFEPSASWDEWVTPRTTEWFSFFYYSYFFILCAYVIPMGLFESRVRILSEMTAGLLFVVCVGHCIYLLVPGRGPYSYLADRFQQPLSGGYWWPMVVSAVDSVDGAARKDIFPSLHTACPTFFTLFAFRNRAHRPYRYAWPITAFFTSQIIIATMFLRWHYLIDVVAGFTLAVVAFMGAAAMVPAELRSRAEFGTGPVWRPLFGCARP